MFYPSETPNCASTDTEAFFTPDDESTYTNTKMLQRVCGTCPVKKECLDYALHNMVLGYWGNTTEVQRKRMRKQLNIIPTSLYLSYGWE